MEKKTYSKEEFQAMVTDLESEFMNLMKSEQEAAQLLEKSEEDSKKEENKEESKEEPKAEAKPEEKKEEPKAEEKKDEDKKEDDESHGYDDEDMEEMHKMYNSMSKGELKAHKESVEKCWMGKCGEMTQMTKSEETSNVPAVKNQETKPSEESDLLKSELESIKKENEDLKKNVEGLVSAINSYVTKKQAPARKAITDIEFVKKSEEGSNEDKKLTKSEIDSILAKKAQDPKTTNQDRAAINSFYLTNAGVEKIAHLLKQ